MAVKLQAPMNVAPIMAKKNLVVFSLASTPIQLTILWFALIPRILAQSVLASISVKGIKQALTVLRGRGDVRMFGEHGWLEAGAWTRGVLGIEH